MTLPVRLTPAAEQDIVLALRWYLTEAPHVLASFEEDIDKSFGRIGDEPEMYQVMETAVRRAPLQRFPFSVFYRILPEWIEVIGVLHQSRDPRWWRRRI